MIPDHRIVVVPTASDTYAAMQREATCRAAASMIAQRGFPSAGRG
jgi:hypothetical protein